MCFIFFFNAKEKNCFIWASFLIFHLAVWMLILQKKKKTVTRGTWVIRYVALTFPWKTIMIVEFNNN